MKTELLLDSSDQVHYFAEYCIKTKSVLICQNKCYIY